MELSLPLEKVKGVGAKTAQSFRDANLITVGDVINFFPRSFEDYSQISTIKDLKPGKVSLRVKAENLKTRQVRRGMHITEASLTDGSGKVGAIWFNQPYRADQLRSVKGEFLVSGEFGLQGKKYQLVNPSVESAEGKHLSTARIVPIYPGVGGLKSHQVRKVMAELKPLIVMSEETLPAATVKDEKLVSAAQALQYLHFPQNSQQITQAQARLGFEELFHLILAAQLNKSANTKLRGWQIAFDQNHAKSFVTRLLFELTNAQRLAIWQIAQDFEKLHPMNRLLQGDVGSGKTVVAGMCASLAARQGFQSALMAPTEILAAQHAETLRNMLSPFGIEVGLLTGSVKPAAKKQLYERIKSGEIDLIVGTHALIQDKVAFHKLGFVTIDEQHRFGVAQRSKLLTKSAHMPHLLAMTATPIPRSLALTVYGELEISVLNELPKNRQPITTRIISPNSREAMYQQVRAQIEAGRQVYVVCPLIEEAASTFLAGEKRSVEAEYKKLRQSVFKRRRIGLLHGQLKPQQKQQAMKDFLDHKLDILVSTTVIEVGVDVPNASVMIIENADQFGLAQAHQLRGRVGRGQYQSYCFLISTDSRRPTRRMRELERSRDGFYLSEIDLQIRGPGEVYGRAQHGQLQLNFASLGDSRLIARVQRAVKQFMDSGENLLHYKQLKEQIEKYQRLTTLN